MLSTPSSPAETLEDENEGSSPVVLDWTNDSVGITSQTTHITGTGQRVPALTPTSSESPPHGARLIDCSQESSGYTSSCAQPIRGTPRDGYLLTTPASFVPQLNPIPSLKRNKVVTCSDDSFGTTNAQADIHSMTIPRAGLPRACKLNTSGIHWHIGLETGTPRLLGSSSASRPSSISVNGKTTTDIGFSAASAQASSSSYP
jgi:hypothetical protein